MKRVKTIRASSFSDEEVSRMRHISAGNREVNTIYLARYMDSSTSEFDNASLSNDTQMLKLFLWNKYIKKTWFRDKYGNILARTNTITTNEKLAVDCYSSSNLMKDPKKSKYPKQEFLQNSNTKEKNRTMRKISKDEETRLIDDDFTVYLKPHQCIQEKMFLPQNKKCADCASKSPNFINFSHRSFICGPCAACHSELGHKVIEIGKHKFTSYEIVRMMRFDAGNEYVNKKFLANYNVLKAKDCPPNKRSSSRTRISWMRKKYDLRLWCYVDNDSIDEESEGSSECMSKDMRLQDLRKSLKWTCSKRIVLDEINDSDDMGSKLSDDASSLTSFHKNSTHEGSHKHPKRNSMISIINPNAILNLMRSKSMKKIQDNSIPKEVTIIGGEYDNDSLSDASNTTSSRTFNSNFVSLESQPVIKKKRAHLRDLYKQMSFRKTRHNLSSSVCSSQRSSRNFVSIQSSSICSSHNSNMHFVGTQTSSICSSKHSSKRYNAKMHSKILSSSQHSSRSRR